VEVLRTFGSGSTGAIDLTGNGLANVLMGNAAGNRLDGGGGADTLHGFAGDDTYVVDDAGDRVVERPGEGFDTVRARISFTLAAHVEALVLEGASDLHATGNALDNRLTGNAGANTLDGKAGADTMIGGAGDDTYFVDDARDVVTEAPGGGRDAVVTSVSYALAPGSSVESLRTYGSATTAAINLTGNEIANTLVGNAAANVLDGRGGADRLIGGAGDDTYHVDHAGDLVTEAAGGGRDTVIASVSYALAPGSEVEVLRTPGSASTGSLNLTGNAFDNTLVGDAGVNVLDGGGGATPCTATAGRTPSCSGERACGGRPRDGFLRPPGRPTVDPRRRLRPDRGRRPHRRSARSRLVRGRRGRHPRPRPVPVRRGAADPLLGRRTARARAPRWRSRPS
jgi:Ca2+-binding RTX toxin-like protein